MTIIKVIAKIQAQSMQFHFFIPLQKIKKPVIEVAEIPIQSERQNIYKKNRT